MGLIQSIIYGFVSGFAELTPVSGPAHQQLTKYLVGADYHQPIFDMLVHIAILLSVIFRCYPTIHRLRKEHNARRRPTARKLAAGYDLRIVKTAAIPMVAGILLGYFLGKQNTPLPSIALGSLLFGIIWLITEHMRHGNKTSRSVSALDALGIGIGSALSAFAGISRLGMGMAVGTAVGAERKNVYTWTLLLCIPAMVVLAFLDLVSLITLGAGTYSILILLYCLIGAVAAFAGGYCAITFMNFLCVKSGFVGVGYYNIGVAIFSFVLYLIT